MSSRENELTLAARKKVQGTACPVCGAPAPPIDFVPAGVHRPSDAFLLAHAQAGLPLRHVAAYHPGVLTRGLMERRKESDKPSERRVEVPLRQNDGVARIDRSSPGHARVIATKLIPANTFLAVYPGWLYSKRTFAALVRAGKRGQKYNVTGFKMKGGVPDFNWQIDPTDGVNTVATRFRGAFGPHMNEPSPGQAANVKWVLNFADGTMEYWTAGAVQAGEELLICYGGAYQRNYDTACSRALQDHYLAPRMRVPLPYFDALNSLLTPARRKELVRGRIVEDAMLLHHHRGMQAKVAAQRLDDFTIWVRHNTLVVRVQDFYTNSDLFRVYLPGVTTTSMDGVHGLVRAEYCTRYECPPGLTFRLAVKDKGDAEETSYPLDHLHGQSIKAAGLKQGSIIDVSIAAANGRNRPAQPRARAATRSARASGSR